MTLRNLPLLAVLLAFGASAAEHDFDFAAGTFRCHVRRLQKPLTGSTSWFEATSEVRNRKVLDGTAQVEQVELSQPTGLVHALTLRLWNPVTKQWSLNFVNAKRGLLSPPPAVGEFRDGRGEFFDQEEWDGKLILVRETFSEVKSGAYHFEQAFSADGARSWEVNWIADCQRVESLPALAQAEDRNRDFDYSIGKWRAHVSRKSGGKWTDADGTADVQTIWGGRASVLELHAGALNGIAIRLFNPEAKNWSLNWVGAKQMTPDVPNVGSFRDGRGEFVDVETMDGKLVFVRQIFMPPSKFVQEVSTDNGRTWEPDLRITFEPLPRDG